MNANKKTAIIIGVLFLTALATSIFGGGLIETIVGAPDYLETVSENETTVIIGVLIELINCAAVVGLAVMLFPILKHQNEALALGYIGFRVIEAMILIVAVISPLTLITLSKEYVALGTADTAYFQTLGTLLTDARGHLTGLLTTVFFSLGALLLFYSLYQSRLVPRFISIWGLIAVALVLAWNLLEALGIEINGGMILALPMILDEVVLGIWLIVKGFNIPAAASGSLE